MAKFILKQTATGFKFDLKNDENVTVATSEVYSTDTACKNGIESVRKFSVGEIENQTVEGFETKKHPKYEVYTDKAGAFRYRLKAVNGQIIAVGASYKTADEAVAAAECVKAIAQGAPVTLEAEK